VRPGCEFVREPGAEPIGEWHLDRHPAPGKHHRRRYARQGSAGSTPVGDPGRIPVAVGRPGPTRRRRPVTAGPRTRWSGQVRPPGRSEGPRSVLMRAAEGRGMPPGGRDNGRSTAGCRSRAAAPQARPFPTLSAAGEAGQREPVCLCRVRCGRGQCGQSCRWGWRCGRNRERPVMAGSGSTHFGASLWSVVGALKRGIAAKDNSAARPWAGPACGA
jgi:hypothetical protein